MEAFNRSSKAFSPDHPFSMNWINLNVTVLDSEEFLGADPVERATWLCLLRYCAGQENGGRIEGATEWKDRKWQQVVRVTLREVQSKCELWAWEGDDLIVSFYPDEKELEVRQRREVAKTNGARGGRPRKTNDETEKETQEKPTSVISGKAEGEGERKEKGNTPLPPSESAPLCTLQQAIANAPMARMSAEAAKHWWHTRNSAGWTKSSASGGAPRKITSWQSDQATSATWAEQGAHEAKRPVGQTPAEKARL